MNHSPEFFDLRGGRAAPRPLRVGDRARVRVRAIRVGSRFTREVWILADGEPHTLLADDEDPEPYGAAYVDRLLDAAGIDRAVSGAHDGQGPEGVLVVERKRATGRADGPRGSQWIWVESAAGAAETR